MTVPLYYNWSALPQWGESGFSAAQAQAGEVAPYAQDFDHGYDSSVGRLNSNRRQRALQHANGNFCDGQYYFPLFVNRVSIDFSISGSQAQSQRTRDFYPHHMVLPGFQLQGQCYDQTSYGELCEFVHAAQHRGFNSNPKYLIQLYVEGNVYPHNKGTRNSRYGVTYNGNFSPNQIVKGQHQPILCLGYIMSMPRKHQQGDYAPTWQVSFMVANMLSGPYSDAVGYTAQASSWINLLTGVGATNGTTPANLATNKKNLAWAAKNSGNIISSTVT